MNEKGEKIMGDGKEVVLKVKFDDYKMISNYIKNDLGINKTVVNEMLKNQIHNININDLIIKKIESLVCRSQHNWNFDNYVKQCVEKIADQEIKNLIDEVTRKTIEEAVRASVEKKLGNLV